MSSPPFIQSKPLREQLPYLVIRTSDTRNAEKLAGVLNKARQAFLADDTGYGAYQKALQEALFGCVAQDWMIGVALIAQNRSKEPGWGYFALELAVERGNEKMVAVMLKNGIRPYPGQEVELAAACRVSGMDWAADVLRSGARVPEDKLLSKEEAPKSARSILDITLEVPEILRKASELTLPAPPPVPPVDNRSAFHQEFAVSPLPEVEPRNRRFEDQHPFLGKRTAVNPDAESLRRLPEGGAWRDHLVAAAVTGDVSKIYSLAGLRLVSPIAVAMTCEYLSTTLPGITPAVSEALLAVAQEAA